MITLCMDTCHKFLTLALFKDEALVASCQKEDFKHQSEDIFVELQKMCADAALTPQAINQVVITEGPGSYTGVRIAMTVAKVFCTQRKIPLYTLGTLQLYSNGEDCTVVLDARGKRVYIAQYRQGQLQGEVRARSIEEVIPELKDTLVYGDGSLVGKEDCWPDCCQAFMRLKDQWKKVDSIHTLTPVYLKDNDAYVNQKRD